jgi:hypothetical protein
MDMKNPLEEYLMDVVRQVMKRRAVENTARPVNNLKSMSGGMDV